MSIISYGASQELIWKHMQSGDDELLTVAEVATRFKVSEQTVRSWIEHNELKAILLPGGKDRKRYRVLASTVEKMLHPPQPTN